MKKTASLALLSAVTIVVACSSNKPVVMNVSTGMDGGAPAGDAGAPPMPPPDAGPVSTGPAFFTDAGSAPAVGEQAFDAAIDLAISTAAIKHAAKMTDNGQPGRATLKEGEHFGMIVTLQPMTCYTFIGFSPPGSIDKLDLKLYGLPLNIQAGSSGANDKGMPIMGGGSAVICPISPIAIPYKVDVVATKGTGRMGVHVFSRPK